MSPAQRRGIGLLVAACVLMGGSAIAGRAELQQRLDQVDSRATALEAELADALRAGERADEALADARETWATYALILAQRADFAAAVQQAEDAFAQAKGKLDTDPERSTVLALQQDVAAERTDAAAVVRAIQGVEAVTSDVTARVAAYDEALLRVSRNATGSLAATDASRPGAARVRAALDAVGGAGVPLQEYGGSCDGVAAAACASPSGVIFFSDDVTRWTDARLHWVMAHELAHIHQFRVWTPLVSSAGYGSLFAGDIELLANCMAQQRGFPSGTVWCSQAQLAWAAEVWRGVVPG